MENNIYWYVIPTIIAILIFIAAVFSEFGARRSKSLKKLEDILRSGSFLSPSFLTIAIGSILIVGAYYNFLFTPGLHLDDSLFHTILRYTEGAIGVCMVLGIFSRIFTFVMFGLYIASFFAFPYFEVLDYLIYGGVAIYLFLIHRDVLSFSFFFHPLGKKEFLDSKRKYALPILRILAGAGMIYASLYHNILAQERALEFLNARPLLNIFESILGIVSVSNEIYLIQAGIFGILFGLLLAFGLLERLTAIVIGLSLLIGVFIVGVNFLPVAIPYFVLVYIIITGNPFEERERMEKA